MSVAMPAVDMAEPSGPTRTGRLRDNTTTEGDRNFAIAMHLSPLSFLVIGFFGLVAPVILWAIRKDDSGYDDDHGREVMNFWLSQIILHLGLGITVIGVALWPVLWVVALVNMVRGASAAGRGEYFRYPMTFRMI